MLNRDLMRTYYGYLECLKIQVYSLTELYSTYLFSFLSIVLKDTFSVSIRLTVARLKDLKLGLDYSFSILLRVNLSLLILVTLLMKIPMWLIWEVAL